MREKSHERCFSIADLRELARRRIPHAVFDYIDGGAEDEITLTNNRRAFDRYQLNASALVDVSQIDLSTTVLGEKISMPLLLSPTAMTRLFHHEGEIAVVKAAQQAGIIYTLSSMSTTSIEDIAESSNTPKWFQIYVWRDRDLLKNFFKRCKETGYRALCLTVDLPVHGNRERDLKNGLTIPPRISPKLLLDLFRHPYWTYHFLQNDAMQLANVADHGLASQKQFILKDYIDSQFDPAVTWEDAIWMVEQWDGPFVIKGISHSEDAKRAVEIGANAIVVSNHGGRQLDHAPGTLEVLEDIVANVGSKIEILIDGGFRRGTDIIKAIALGAKACMIGRPYLYGLCAGGKEGVDRTLQIYQEELYRNMQLIGCRTISEIDSRILKKTTELAAIK